MKQRPKKTIIGTTQCVCCGRDIPAKESETGTLDVSCQWCELPTYAKKGTEAHRVLMARVKRHAEPEPDATNPVHAPPAEPKPAARAARSVFDVFSGA
ncbi:hypothetical protein [Burkholderia stagnalis]|uniref:hypothetical protein n=1 Tax=Burkholderia stagnalis TaxID=1503054 RepID=UPI000F576519|nr:hypothetical protein [Burkholderia stagnalis]RQQ65553.1 hypothetical protein DF137_22490 [Burkholderia stagnalis]RQQ78187.1 hypothetical protein DF138_21785 [Burkholderia stagnalis]RQQ87790.1 hypothetical protein DF136_21455 [Burkholderia stagnalis]